LLFKYSHFTLFRRFNPIINILINHLYGGLHPIGFPSFEELRLLIALLKRLPSTVSEHYHWIRFSLGRWCR
jgi:hypothetical protein